MVFIMIYMWSDLLVHNDCLNNIIIRQKKMEKQTVFYACAFVYYRCQKKREPDHRKRGTQNEKGVTRILSMFLWAHAENTHKNNHHESLWRKKQTWKSTDEEIVDGRDRKICTSRLQSKTNKESDKSAWGQTNGQFQLKTESVNIRKKSGKSKSAESIELT